MQTITWQPMPRFMLRRRLVSTMLNGLNCKNKTCLEMGYGAGGMFPVFVHKGLVPAGYDSSPHSLRATKEYLQSLGLSDRVRIFESMSETERGGPFDFVCAFEVLEHIEDDKGALDQWRKLLKPDGSLILSVPAHKSKWGYNDVVAGHVRRYEKKELEDVLRRAGFKDIRIFNYGYPMTLVLDGLNNWADRKKEEKNKLQGQSAQDLTSVSFAQDFGMKKTSGILSKLLNDFTMSPWYALQRLFSRFDLGSGYIVRASIRESRT